MLFTLKLLTGFFVLIVVVLFGNEKGVDAQGMVSQFLASPSGPSKSLSPSAQKKLSLDFQNANLHDVLRILAVEGGFNLVVTDDVQGQVTLRLSEVTWQQALRIVLQARGLVLRRQGSIVFVNYSAG
jgi:type II secretory pathway component HofQ